MTAVNKKTEPVTRQAVPVITFTPSPTVRNLSQRQIWKGSTNTTCGTRPMTNPLFEAMIGHREPRKKLHHAAKSRRFQKEGDNGRARATSNRSKSIQELKKVTTCNRCGALGHWGDECPQKGHRQRSSPSDRSSGSGRFRKRSSSRKRPPKGKGKKRRVCHGDPEEKKSRMNVPPGWTVLECGAGKSLAGAEPVAMLAQACEVEKRNIIFVESENK